MKRSRELEDTADQVTADIEAANAAPVQVSKIVGVDVDDLDVNPRPSSGALVRCSLPGHVPGMSFTAYTEFETHYNNAHTNRCIDCKKNFPSSHILTLHLMESHDAIVAVRRDKGEHVYACFVEGCNQKFETTNKRRQHLIDNHLYPPNYFFAVTKFGIDNRTSMLVESERHKGQFKPVDNGQHKSRNRQAIQGARHRKRLDAITTTSVASKSGQDISAEENPENKSSASSDEAFVKDIDTEMDDLAGSMSALRFVPTSVRFGPRQKAGFARR